MKKKVQDNNRYREEELEQNPNLEEDEKLVVEESDEEKVKELQEQIDKIKDEMLRDRAELENFKKRTNEERMRERKYHLQDILTELIEIIDLFDCVVNTKTDDEKVKSFLVGFQMLNNKFKEILSNYDVKKIEALNKPFDSNIHEAISLEYEEGIEPGICIKVTSNGYMYKDRVLRPSKVIVSKGKEEN